MDDIIGRRTRELYQLPPEEFRSARDAMVRQARRTGDRALADRLGGIRKPQLAAWLVDRLATTQKRRLADFLALADSLQAAQAAGDSRRLRELSRQRQRLLDALVERARAAGQGAGRNLTSTVLAQVEETLTAALAEPQVGQQVRDGSLQAPTRYSGLGPVPPVGLHGVPAPSKQRERPTPGRGTGKPVHPAPGGGQPTDEHRPGAASKQREQAGAVRRAAALEQARTAQQQAVEREQEAGHALAELDDRLAQLRGTLRQCMRDRDRQARVHENRRRELSRAQSRLASLERRH